MKSSHVSRRTSEAAIVSVLSSKVFFDKCVILAI